MLIALLMQHLKGTPALLYYYWLLATQGTLSYLCSYDSLTDLIPALLLAHLAVPSQLLKPFRLYSVRYSFGRKEVVFGHIFSTPGDGQVRLIEIQIMRTVMIMIFVMTSTL